MYCTIPVPLYNSDHSRCESVHFPKLSFIQKSLCHVRIPDGGTDAFCFRLKIVEKEGTVILSEWQGHLKIRILALSSPNVPPVGLFISPIEFVTCDRHHKGYLHAYLRRSIIYVQYSFAIWSGVLYSNWHVLRDMDKWWGKKERKKLLMHI